MSHGGRAIGVRSDGSSNANANPSKVNRHGSVLIVHEVILLLGRPHAVGTWQCRVRSRKIGVRVHHTQPPCVKTAAEGSSDSRSSDDPRRRRAPRRWTWTSWRRSSCVPRAVATRHSRSTRLARRGRVAGSSRALPAPRATTRLAAAQQRPGRPRDAHEMIADLRDEMPRCAAAPRRARAIRERAQ